MKFKKLAVLPYFEEPNPYLDISKYPIINIDGSKVESVFSGSQCATPEILKDRIRVWFSARNYHKNSQPFYYDLSRSNPLEIIGKCTEPQIPLGSAGTANESGCMISQVRGMYKYFTGWNNTSRSDVKYRTAIMGTYRGKEWIIRDRTTESPCGTSMYFRPNQGSVDYWMSFKRWVGGEPLYGINCYDEYFGEHPILDDSNFCYARPVTIVLDNIDHLFYSKRSVFDYRENPANSYKIYVKKEHYKEDSVKELVEIEGEENARMICYGYPIQVDNRVLMFYNNDFQSQICLAEMIND